MINKKNFSAYFFLLIKLFFYCLYIYRLNNSSALQKEIDNSFVASSNQSAITNQNSQNLINNTSLNQIKKFTSNIDENDSLTNIKSNFSTIKPRPTPNHTLFDRQV